MITPNHYIGNTGEYERGKTTVTAKVVKVLLMESPRLKDRHVTWFCEMDNGDQIEPWQFKVID